MEKGARNRVAIHDACIGGHIECVSQLIQMMSDIDIPDSNGQTAAHHAAFNGEIKVLKLLQENGT